VFGGCAFEKYPTSGNKHDDKAFLFQLHPNQVMLKNTLNPTYKNHALMCNSGSLSIFGYNYTFIIKEPKNGKKSLTRFDYVAYELPPGCNQE
jgi:hypothetical protein